MRLTIFLLFGLVILSCTDKNEDRKDEYSAYNSTYEVIQEEIWNVACISCHVAGSSFAQQSDLILTADVSYDQLLNRIPNNESAGKDGLVLVGDEGLESLYNSFLWEKINSPDIAHFYSDHPQYGSIMPLGGDFLTNGELEFIREWILAGAPREGKVSDTKNLADETRFEDGEFEPLSIPTQGYQFHIGPFPVGPNQDREILSYELLNNQEPVYIREVEFTMRKGSHHFILYSFQDDSPISIIPTSSEIRDVYKENGEYDYLTLFTMQYHEFITGTQWPKFRYQFPEGVALEVPANSGFDLNIHYANRTPDFIDGEAYANIHTTDKVNVEHVAKILNLSDRDFNLPAGKITTIKTNFTFENQRSIFQLFSHAHEHMLEFKVFIVGGERNNELVYVSYDWEHPPVLKLDPPLILEAGSGLRIETTYDNWESHDLKFGLRSTDEMMILFGAYY